MLPGCAHHFNVESKHGHMNTTWHLIDGSEEWLHDFVFIFPVLTVIIGFGEFFYSFYDNAYSSFVKKIEIMIGSECYFHNSCKFSELLRLKQELTHFFNIKCSLAPFMQENFFYSGHDVIPILIIKFKTGFV